MGVHTSDEAYVLPYPYNVLCPILFIAILAASVALSAKYATLRKYAVFLAIVGIIEVYFSGYNMFPTGVIIGFVTISFGFAVPSIYQLKWNPNKNQGKLLLISAGCILLSAGSFGIFHLILPAFLWLMLLAAGSYLLILGVAGFFVVKRKSNN